MTVWLFVDSFGVHESATNGHVHLHACDVCLYTAAAHGLFICIWVCLLHSIRKRYAFALIWFICVDFISINNFTFKLNILLLCIDHIESLIFNRSELVHGKTESFSYERDVDAILAAGE